MANFSEMALPRAAAYPPCRKNRLERLFLFVFFWGGLGHLDTSLRRVNITGNARFHRAARSAANIGTLGLGFVDSVALVYAKVLPMGL